MLELKPKGAERSLPERLFGFNSPVTYRVPHEDPMMIPAAKKLEPAFLRFPGGTVANYFDWRTGQLKVPRVEEGASVYRKFLIQAEPWTRQLHPNGVTMERFTRIAKEVDAEVVFVPNLESSTLEEQAAWFADMESKGVVPRLIEMGNEFYLALLGDKETKRIFPDWATTLRITKDYLDAFRSHLPQDARIAVQAAASRLHSLEDPGEESWHHRAWLWDDALSSEPWFDAVTAHLYPDISAVPGPDALAGLPGNMDKVYPALVARADEGLERALDFIRQKLPDKEIWITEWGPLAAGALFQGKRVVFTAMWLHMVARGCLSLLKVPLVTIVLYHALFFDGSLMAVFGPDPSGQGYVPTGPAGLLHWFHEAANRGATYQQIEVEGAKRIVAQGTIPNEGFHDVEAALFQKKGSATLIAHNASSSGKRVGLSSLMEGKAPDKVEVIETPDLAEEYSTGVPPVREIEAGSTLEMPAYSILRAVWRA